MPNLSSTYYSKIYKEFKDIDLSEHLSVVRFYETYESDIPYLNFSEYFELLICYIDALFEIGAYHSHLKIVDTAIQVSIINNIKFYNGKDIYTELLFKKAAACYNLMEYKQTEHILRELIKISPHNKLYHQFLRKCLRRNHPEYLKNTRGLSILLLLTTAFIVAIELLFIRSLFESYTAIFETARNTTFAIAVLLLAGSAFFHHSEVYYWVKRFADECKMRKTD